MTGRAYAVAGGKGGVGKTTTVVNLGVMLRVAGHRVAVVDADLGMANVATVLGIDHEPTLHDVLAGEATVGEAVVEEPAGFGVVPGSAGLEEFAAADPEDLDAVLEELATDYDYVLVDTGAGLSFESVVPVGMVDGVLLVTTPERSAVTDTVKTAELVSLADGPILGAVLTRTDDATDPEAIAEALGCEILGVIPEDPAIQRSIDEQKPLITLAPDSPAATAYRTLGKTLLERVDRNPAEDSGSEEAEGTTGDSGAVDDAAGDVSTTNTEPTDGSSEPSNRTASSTIDLDDGPADTSDAEGEENESEKRPATPSSTPDGTSKTPDGTSKADLNANAGEDAGPHERPGGTTDPEIEVDNEPERETEKNLDGRESAPIDPGTDHDESEGSPGALDELVDGSGSFGQDLPSMGTSSSERTDEPSRPGDSDDIDPSDGSAEKTAVPTDDLLPGDGLTEESATKDDNTDDSATETENVRKAARGADALLDEIGSPRGSEDDDDETVDASNTTDDSPEQGNDDADQLNPDELGATVPQDPDDGPGGPESTERNTEPLEESPSASPADVGDVDEASTDLGSDMEGESDEPDDTDADPETEAGSDGISIPEATSETDEDASEDEEAAGDEDDGKSRGGFLSRLFNPFG